jgi:hypothetical protein
LLGIGLSVLLAAVFHWAIKATTRWECGDRLLSDTGLSRYLKPALTGAILFVISWWLVAILAFPIVVLLLGFTLHEGWAFLTSKPQFALVFLSMPLIVIPFSCVMAVKVYQLARRRQQSNPV